MHLQVVPLVTKVWRQKNCLC